MSRRSWNELPSPRFRDLVPPDQVPVELERRLIAAVGDEQEHAQVRQDIRDAGFPELADELDRIAAGPVQ